MLDMMFTHLFNFDNTSIEVDIDTFQQINLISKRLKMDLDSYFDNTLNLLLKKITKENFDIFLEIQASVYETTKQIVKLDALIMKLVMEEAFNFFKTELEISDKTIEKFEHLKNVIKEKSQNKYSIINDEEQWENPAFVSMLNKWIILISNNLYLSELSNDR